MSEICTTCGLPKELCVFETIAKENQLIEVRAEKRKFGKQYTVSTGIDTKEIDIEQLGKKLKNLSSIEQYLAAKWCLDYYYALCRKKPRKYELVIYAKMVKNGEAVLKQIFTALGMDVPKAAFSQIKIPSLTAHHGDPWKMGPLLGWTKVLNKDQIQSILDVVEMFGMDFYTDDLEPDYDRLENSPMS